jgi:hypothetical protein
VIAPPIGVVAVVYGNRSLAEAAGVAEAAGFAHIDSSPQAVEALGPAGVAALGIPVVDLIGTDPATCSTVMAPALRDERSFDWAVSWLGAHPGVRAETVPGSVAGSVERARALCAAVPALRLTVDTGHVATWGEDPVELLDLAGHVQLRQAAPGRPQLHPDEGGDVDFSAVLRRLAALEYRGVLSVEYFDLPTWGWPLADPPGHARALADHVRRCA